ncbi:MAG: ABC transporter permease [Chryseolinea sp.]
MIFKYVKLALRNLVKRKLFTAINILGLSTGVAVCLLIGKYIIFESSYDKFHAHSESIYRVVSSFYTDGLKEEYNGYDLGPMLAASFPEIRAFARAHNDGSLVSLTEHGEEVKYREKKMLYVDSAFLKIFSFKILNGNPVTALRNANAAILTESIAKKYFGRGDPLGKVIQLHHGWTQGLFEITEARLINLNI